MDLNLRWGVCAHALVNATFVALESRRSFRTAVCLACAGEYMVGAQQIVKGIWERQEDGGWADVDETTWAVSGIDAIGGWTRLSAEGRRESIEWLRNERTADGAWGQSARDMSRIPITAWVLTLLPELADERSLAWLEAEWKRDLVAATKLTYKGALTLKAFASVDVMPKDAELIERTVEYLVSEQNGNGGFGPWRDHPVGSEPWSTGIVLIGLTAWPDLVPSETLEKALAWLGETQLRNGLWPCHYIEEGSAYCYWGAVEAMKLLKRRGR